MPVFAFTVTTSTGDRSTGTVIAPDRESAERLLVERNLVVTRLAPVSQRRRNILEMLGLASVSWSGEQLVSFTEQLAAMTEAGLNPKAAIDIMCKESKNPDVLEILMELSNGLASGHSFTELLGRYPSVFDSQFVAMVAAGESSGRLPETLQRLALLIQRSQELKRKVQGAFYYPAFILALSMVMIAALFVFGIPRFKQIYDGLGGELPTITVIFMNIGAFLSTYWIGLGVLLVLLAIMLGRFVRTNAGRMFVDAWKLRLPVVGELYKRLAIARFARTLGSLHASGIAMVTALELVADSMGNMVMAEVVRRATGSVLEGESMVDALSRSGYFTEMAVSMLSVGEQSGSMDVMLNRVADYYENQVDITVKALTGLLEPAILVFVGVVIGVVVFAMVLPVFRLATLLFEH